MQRTSERQWKPAYPTATYACLASACGDPLPDRLVTAHRPLELGSGGARRLLRRPEPTSAFTASDLLYRRIDRAYDPQRRKKCVGVFGLRSQFKASRSSGKGGVLSSLGRSGRVTCW